MAETRMSFKADALTRAEEALLAVLSEDISIKNASERMGVSYKVISLRAQTIREKLYVKTTSDAVRVWIERRG